MQKALKHELPIDKASHRQVHKLAANRHASNSVTGEVTKPSSDVEPTDRDAPTIQLHEIPFNRGVLRRHEPLVLYPYPSPCQKYFTARFEDIDMDITDASIVDLKDAIESVLRMDWEDYAMGNPDEMTQGAKELRNRLLALYRYEIVDNP